MKKKIKKFPKTLFVMIAVIAVIAVCLTGLFVYNRIMLKKDAVLLKKHVGQMVEVDGHDMVSHHQYMISRLYTGSLVMIIRSWS